MTTDIPALQQLSNERQVPISGKDFKIPQIYDSSFLVEA